MKSKKQNILFISYVFPPTGGAGIQRTVKLVKYFDIMGWNVSVLTAKNPSVPVHDTRMLKDISSRIKIYRSLSFELPYAIKRKFWNKSTPANNQNEVAIEGNKPPIVSSILAIFKKMAQRIMLPDPQIGWNYTALKHAKKIIKKNDINYVFISAPPFSSLMLIPGLKNTPAKLIADFRDEWTEFYLNSYDFHKRDDFTVQKIINIEKNIFQNSDLVTMATSMFVSNYQKKYLNAAHKIKVLTNGFDPDDFIEKPIKSQEATKQFYITYTGTVFNVTTLRYFLNAMDQVFKIKPKLLEKVIINIVGRITEDEQIWFDQFKNKDNLILHGYLVTCSCR